MTLRKNKLRVLVFVALVSLISLGTLSIVSAAKPTTVSSYFVKWFGSFDTPPSTPANGSMYYDTDKGKSFIYDGGWIVLAQDGAQGAKGDKGDTGATGEQGIAGTAATVTIGTVTTGGPGTAAAVTNSGTSSAVVLDFTIPRGDTGASGFQGKSLTMEDLTVGTQFECIPSGAIDVIFRDTSGIPYGDPQPPDIPIHIFSITAKLTAKNSFNEFCQNIITSSSGFYPYVSTITINGHVDPVNAGKKVYCSMESDVDNKVADPGKIRVTGTIDANGDFQCINNSVHWNTPPNKVWLNSISVY